MSSSALAHEDRYNVNHWHGGTNPIPEQTTIEYKNGTTIFSINNSDEYANGMHVCSKGEQCFTCEGKSYSPADKDKCHKTLGAAFDSGVKKPPEKVPPEKVPPKEKPPADTKPDEKQPQFLVLDKGKGLILPLR